MSRSNLIHFEHSMSESLTTPPPRTRRLRQASQLFMFWLRRSLEPENLWQGFKTLAWVCPLTILIWVYAEREQVATDKDISFSIEVRINDPKRVVSLQRPVEKVVVADLSGPRSNLDNVIAKLQRHNSDEPGIEITVDPSYSPGIVHEMFTKEALEANPLFRQNGITLAACLPAKLAIDVDDLDELDLEVQVPPGVTNLVGAPVFDPRSVKIRGPHRAIQKAKTAGKLAAYAELDGLDVLKTPGPHDIPAVRITPLEDPSLSFSPATVSATLSVRESDVTYTIPSVPVWIYGAPGVLGKYRVETQTQVLTNVKVTGPPDKIELLQRKDFSPQPHAMLEVRSDDAGKPSVSRPIRFDLPPGMNLRVSDDDSQRTVEFHLVEEKTPE